MNYLICTVFLSLSLLLACQNKSTTKSSAPATEAAPEEMTIETIGEGNLYRQIESTAKALAAKAEEKTDIALATKLIRDSKNYADKYRKNEKTPGILFRAGEVSRSIQQPEEAINIFRRLYTQFPKSSYAPKALFLEANTFEDDLKNIEIARKTYQQVIDKYPDDELAAHSRQILKVIDKSPEELIKEFQEKNK